MWEIMYGEGGLRLMGVNLIDGSHPRGLVLLAGRKEEGRERVGETRWGCKYL
jgi:hypothetical protein